MRFSKIMYLTGNDVAHAGRRVPATGRRMSNSTNTARPLLFLEGGRNRHARASSSQSARLHTHRLFDVRHRRRHVVRVGARCRSCRPTPGHGGMTQQESWRARHEQQNKWSAHPDHLRRWPHTQVLYKGYFHYWTAVPLYHEP